MSNMKALVENVAKAQAIAEGVRWSTYDKAGDALRKNAIDLRYGSAKASVIALLEHFSDPGNVTDAMAVNFADMADRDYSTDVARTKHAFSAAFRAARSELDE